MSDTTGKNTGKPGLTRKKRSTRAVENEAFDGFARRIIAAYGRRVAAGDIEALRSLTSLSAEIDATVRLAVAGLRAKPHTYSWGEIAARLGVTRQAVQMRYGDTAERGRLDQRLIDAGIGVSVATLAAVFADHHPGLPASLVCPGCGYRYPDGMDDCPTNQVVRPLLLRRRNESKPAIAALTRIQLDDLLDTKRTRKPGALKQASRPATSADRPQNLLDLIDGKDSTP
ncbi:hypothetical protein [Luedemannella helvata]|uniref:Uncharacterized protein n=1 Tax=Luedemannella helvata TaxID=349315 RepID=A0ABN2L319_9ACTN